MIAKDSAKMKRKMKTSLPGVKASVLKTWMALMGC